MRNEIHTHTHTQHTHTHTHYGHLLRQECPDLLLTEGKKHLLPTQQGSYICMYEVSTKKEGLHHITGGGGAF